MPAIVPRGALEATQEIQVRVTTQEVLAMVAAVILGVVTTPVAVEILAEATPEAVATSVEAVTSVVVETSAAAVILAVAAISKPQRQQRKAHRFAGGLFLS